MFRSFDWECQTCGNVDWRVVGVPSGSSVPTEHLWPCDMCEAETLHDRVLSLPAPYMGERVYNPQVAGGKFDTLGHKIGPSLPPPLPPEAKAGDWVDRWQSKEFKERKAAIVANNKENAAKRKRAAALKRGENVNMRTDKLAGDPKITA